MNRKGFTLMELLLVVAVLAIVAAAAAPTFFGGAQDAMNEARKANFMSAYQNTLSGANIYVSLQASKGITVETNDLKAQLNNYCPEASRMFDLGNNINGTLTAGMNDTTHAVEVMIAANSKVINLGDITSNTAKELDYANLCTLVKGSN